MKIFKNLLVKERIYGFPQLQLHLFECCCLRTRLFLLFLPQSPQGDTGNLDGLEFNTGNITDGVTLATETGNQDFVVDFDKVQATVIGDESSDLLASTSQLNTDTLTNGRVGLFRFDTAKREKIKN